MATCSVSGGKLVSPGGPCFVRVSQTGSTTSLPRSNGGWAEEISLDIDMVSAICPNCNIALVEASSSSLSALGTAEDEAAKLGADEISNSYAGSESPSDTTYDIEYYDHPGIAITASSGDDGYGVGYPAASQYVTAVGGTTLNRSTSPFGTRRSEIRALQPGSGRPLGSRRTAALLSTTTYADW